MAAPTLAILLFQVEQARNFIHDDQLPALVRMVTDAGVDCQVFETTLPSADGPDAGDLGPVDALIDALRGRYAVCAYLRLWSDDVFTRLRAALPGVVWVYLGDPRHAFAGVDHAFNATHVPALLAVVRAAAEGVAPSPDDLASAPVELPRVNGPPRRLPVLIGDRARPDRPAMVHGSPGCAFSLDVRDNPRFADVDLSAPDVTLRGCSFCATGGVPRRSASETLASVLAQLDDHLASTPGLTRVQVHDQNPFPYLVELVERVGQRASQPIEILIESRADWFLAAQPTMERALAAAERSGHTILLFLVGLENLSPRELELYNKGVTAAQNEEALHASRRLKSLYPKGYSSTRAAFGFILYNPWTELADLRLNVEAATRLGLSEFRGEITRSKLRLYPDTALYLKALRDGVVTDRFPYEAMDSARRYGYAAEVPWRFVHPATDAAYGMHDILWRELGAHDELAMLGEVLNLLEAQPGRVGEPVARLAQEVARGLGRRLRAMLRPGPRRTGFAGSAPR